MAIKSPKIALSKDDFPDPTSPIMHVKDPLGMETLICFKVMKSLGLNLIIFFSFFLSFFFFLSFLLSFFFFSSYSIFGPPHENDSFQITKESFDNPTDQESSRLISEHLRKVSILFTET